MFTHWSQFVPLNYVNTTSEDIALYIISHRQGSVQELCESRGGRLGLPVLMNLMVSVDVKQH